MIDGVGVMEVGVTEGGVAEVGVMEVGVTGYFEPTPDPGRFIATPACHAPWSPDQCHGGTTSALLVRAMEAVPSTVRGPAWISRFTTEILRPVPLGEVTVSARVVRPGRSVELVEAELAAAGRTAMVARAWRIRETDLILPAPAAGPGGPRWAGFPPVVLAIPPVPPEPQHQEPAIWRSGYATGVDWRFVAGSAAGGEPALVWARPHRELIGGEAMSPVARAVLLADTGNGLSRVLDVDTWWFINVELTVHLLRMPVGEWTLLGAMSTVEPHGAGLAETELFDEKGRVGRATQALMVGPR